MSESLPLDQATPDSWLGFDLDDVPLGRKTVLSVEITPYDGLMNFAHDVLPTALEILAAKLRALECGRVASEVLTIDFGDGTHATVRMADRSVTER